MIFNSLPFLFAFLPACLAFYLLLSHWMPALRCYFLIAATIAFYSFGGLKYTALLLASVAANYAVAQVITHWRGTRLIGYVLPAAVVGNLALLGLFKYTSPLIDGWNVATGAQVPYLELVLPIGISFFTFQQIGFLIDLNRGKFELRRWQDYAGFILFFPTLLAGPITRYDEMAPQLAQEPAKGMALRNICIGLAIFAVGFAKKSMLADTLGLYAGPVFDSAADGAAPGLIDGWLAAFSYTAQLYFDFSGYSDMAIGVARMFGFVLPANFHSPLRSTSTTEIWRRWHISLGRWVQSYIFQPLSVPMARLAARHDAGKWGMFWIGFAVPTTASMVTIALWHGAGATFLFFGLCQGGFMIINEWSRMRRKQKKGAKGKSPSKAWTAFATALTILCFTFTSVAFNAPTFGVMTQFYGGMAGLNGSWGPVFDTPNWPAGLPGALLVLVLAWLIIIVPPNTQQFMARYNPVLEWPRWSTVAAPILQLEWRMSLRWAMVTGLLFFLGFIFMMRGTTKFIYFNF